MRKIVYMEWVKTRPRARYEIGGSGVIPVSISELPELRDAIELNAFNLYGYQPLVQAIAARYEIAAECVVTTQGTSMANYLAMAAVLNPGDEVLVESPAYEPLLDLPVLLGAKIRRVERRFRDGFRIDLDDFRGRLNKHTKLIVLTNLHNPSGVLTPAEDLREIARLAHKAGAHVLVDEVYMDFLFDSRPPSAVHLGPNVITTCSLTKAYGLDGLRCGWVLAPAKLAKAMWRLQDFFGVNGAIPAEIASTQAFAHLDRFIDRTRRILETNRPLVDTFMHEHCGELRWVAPHAGPVCFPKLRTGSVRKLTAKLKSDYDTGVIPGEFFEMPRHFRVGFGGPTADLKAGLERLSRALSS